MVDGQDEKAPVMTAQSMSLLNTMAHELDIPEDELLKQSLATLLERRLQEIKAEIFAITGQYQVGTVKEMEEQYMKGNLDEAGSWEDFQHLDHLEYKRDQLVSLLTLIQ
jgi:hypothetical protein